MTDVDEICAMVQCNDACADWFFIANRPTHGRTRDSRQDEGLKSHADRLLR